MIALIHMHNHPKAQQRLRILHITSGDRWAGAEVQAFTLMSELKQSHEVYAIVLNKGELANQLENIGIPTTVFDETSVSTLQIFLSICKEIRHLKPHIVHTHRQKENILGSIANLITIRAKCIRTVHGAPEFNPKGIKKLLARLDTICGNYFQNGIIAVSTDLQEKLLLHFKKEKLHTIYNGVDISKIRGRLKEADFKKENPQKIHIGIIGRIEPVKRVDIFLSIAHQLLNAHPMYDWHFHVFGDGSLEPAMKKLADTLELNRHITFHGLRMDMNDCISSLNAVIMCSDHEGLPMTALECLAIGTPIIVHNVGGLTELLKDAPHLTVATNKAENYVNKILRIVPNEERMPTLGKKYTSSESAIDTVAFYKDRLNNKKSLRA